MRAMYKNNAGFTLVEMIMVIVITGIIGGMVAMFIRAPVQGYVDSARRAELTDIADTAVRRIARDVRTAVPNSVRFTNCAAPCVEFIPAKDGGRYRVDAPGNRLVFGPAGTTTFDIVGNAIPIIAGTDYIVIGSTQSDGSVPYSEAGAGVLRKVTAMANGNTTVTFAAPVLPISAELISKRFDVVDGVQKAVTYACENTGTDANNNGTGVLKRYWGYGFAAAPSTGSSAILADRISACAFDYNNDVSLQRFGLLAVRLTLTSGGESVTLYNEIHVNNRP